MKVVVNATPLIALSLINRLELLHQLFDLVIVPRNEKQYQQEYLPCKVFAIADWQK